MAEAPLPVRPAAIAAPAAAAASTAAAAMPRPRVALVIFSRLEGAGNSAV